MAIVMSQKVAKHGDENIISLRAGSLSMTFDKKLACLRYVSFTAEDGSPVEVIRGVYAAVRNRDWDSVPFVIRNFRLDQQTDQFELTWETVCSQDEVDFEWNGRVTGKSNGEVTFHFDGKARCNFGRNRIGICVLHPIDDCVGRPCQIIHSDGQISDAEFPHAISPHQPFLDMQAIAYQPRPNIEVQIAFEGDIFETEDQRNWTDASFKTYSTPLALPFPVGVKEGDCVEQQIRLRVANIEARTAIANADSGSASRVTQVDAPVQISLDWNVRKKLPAIGLSMATGEPAERICSDEAIEQLRDLRLDHLRVEYRTADSFRTQRLDAALELVKQLDVKLEVALHLEGFSDQPSTSDSWQRMLDELSRVSALTARFLVFDSEAPATPAELARSSKQALGKLNASASIAVGTDAYFAELNRNRPPRDVTDLVCYSINPQIHAFDNLSLIETLAGQRATVESAEKYFGCPVAITPVTLLPRFNPNATSPLSRKTESAPGTDPRQSTSFAAAWTAGSIGQLATHPAVASLTFFETVGPRGLMTIDGRLYPVASVFQQLGRHNKICPTQSSHPLAVAAVALADASRRTLVLANYSAAKREVVIVGSDEQTRFSVEAETIRIVSEEELR